MRPHVEGSNLLGVKRSRVRIPTATAFGRRRLSATEPAAVPSVLAAAGDNAQLVVEHSMDRDRGCAEQPFYAQLDVVRGVRLIAWC